MFVLKLARFSTHLYSEGKGKPISKFFRQSSCSYIVFTLERHSRGLKTFWVLLKCLCSILQIWIQVTTIKLEIMTIWQTFGTSLDHKSKPEIDLSQFFCTFKILKFILLIINLNVHYILLKHLLSRMPFYLVTAEVKRINPKYFEILTTHCSVWSNHLMEFVRNI